jgi:hypothetical protein
MEDFLFVAAVDCIRRALEEDTITAEDTDAEAVEFFGID